MTIISNPKTVGWSPKSYTPAIIGLTVGLILVILGYVTVGLAIVATSLAHLGISYAAPPGKVEV